jgi:hypothetical protein
MSASGHESLKSKAPMQSPTVRPGLKFNEVGGAVPPKAVGRSLEEIITRAVQTALEKQAERFQDQLQAQRQEIEALKERMGEMAPTRTSPVNAEIDQCITDRVNAGITAVFRVLKAELLKDLQQLLRPEPSTPTPVRSRRKLLGHWGDNEKSDPNTKYEHTTSRETKREGKNEGKRRKTAKTADESQASNCTAQYQEPRVPKQTLDEQPTEPQEEDWELIPEDQDLSQRSSTPVWCASCTTTSTASTLRPGGQPSTAFS